MRKLSEKYGAWCVLENVDLDPETAPKYQALLELVAGDRICIRVTRKEQFIFEIFDLNGRRYRLESLNSPGQVTFGRARLSKGIYITRMTDRASGAREQVLLRLQK